MTGSPADGQARAADDQARAADDQARAPHEPVVRLRGAAFSYADRRIFAELDLDVHRGEVLTILGPNGCGKSTLLRCIGGALTLDHGTLRVGGAELSALDPAARARKIGFLFQDHSPSFPFTVLDVAVMGRTPHLGFFGAPAAKDVEIALEALDQVGMLHLQDRPYTDLSGGERQLVLLARTLTQQPEIVLLDEPTSHLDFRNQVLCLRAVGGLAARGVTMLMTTHDPNHAFLFQGRALLMFPGKPPAVGPAADIITGAALSAAYGIPIEVFSVPRRTGAGEFRFCTPW
ncbi:MAG TPA: ABC transporter ATP-binding protein [Steroidobacteraceae bacterium]|jgi:iron complex transport system ATP-binding protein|nr:ABC transporter ATP-binding protein [Steroidobacteraceae bacterium]